MAVVNAMNPIMPTNVKDSRWLTLEVCREYQRNKCTRTDHECKFAHPPAHVEVQNGRVIACFDSIKGKCQRKDPPCKYLHPPQHLREQLLQNGRNNLILRSLQMQTYHQVVPAGIIPMAGAKAVAYPTAVLPGQIPYVAAATPQTRAAHVSHPASFASPYLSTVPTSAVAQFNPYGMPAVQAVQSGATDGQVVTTPQVPGVITTAVPVSKAPTRPDRLEPQVVEVLAPPTPRKRPRDSAEELVLPQYGLPPFKRLAVPDSSSLGKSGIPVYQPTIPTAAAYQQATLMQLQQQPSYPVTYSSEVLSPAYTNYLPQVAGHPPAVPRF